MPALLREVQDDSAREIVLHNVTREWAKLDPYAAYEWASTDPTLKDVPGDAAGGVFGVIARGEFRTAAIPIALTFPIDSEGIGPEAGHHTRHGADGRGSRDRHAGLGTQQGNPSGRLFRHRQSAGKAGRLRQSHSVGRERARGSTVGVL